MKHITDIHMHVIPDVDDGSRNLEESITMLRMSANQGVGTVVATPHSWYIDSCGYDHMLSQYEDLKEAVIERKVHVRLYLGCEVLFTLHTVDACIRKLDDGRYPTMAGSRYVLTEFYELEEEKSMELCIQKIISAGYVPIIAHAERYRNITMEGIKVLKDFDALIQINAYSIADERNSQTRQLANSCLSERIVDFIGSDAHRLNHRPPVIKSGIDAMIQRYTEEYAKQVAVINPQLFLK